jgi:enoyl-CoA hydratase/carnithine racemase
MADNLSLLRRDDGVALLTIRIAGDDAAVFTAGFAADLSAAVDEIQAREDIAGTVITGSAEGVFLGGARLDGLLAGRAGGLSAADAARLLAPVNRTLRKLECGKPAAAAINGRASGGGFELALACHRRFLCDAPGATVGLDELAAGLIPGGGGTQRLPRRIGIAAALPLLLEARQVAPADALALGLVDEVLPTHELVPAAARWVLAHRGVQQPWDMQGWRIPGGAGALASHAAASFGLGVARVRRDLQAGGVDRSQAALALLAAVYEGSQLPMDRALALEAKYFARLVTGPGAGSLLHGN